MKTLIAGLLLAAVAGAAIAQATPAGLWKTIDDETKAEKSLVRITDAGGVMPGDTVDIDWAVDNIGEGHAGSSTATVRPFEASAPS